MTDADELERIRERKRRELLEGSEPGAEQPDEGATPGEPVHVEGAAHLDELVASNAVVLADFYADWCGPCKMLEPVVATVAAETDAVVAKVDVDVHQGLSAQYGVQGVPTLVLFADGEPVERTVGVTDEGALRELVDRYAGADER